MQQCPQYAGMIQLIMQSGGHASQKQGFRNPAGYWIGLRADENDKIIT